MSALLDEVRRIIREELAAKPAPVTMLSDKGTADRLGVSVSTVRAMRRDGRLPFTKIGRSVRIASDAVIGAPAKPVDDLAARRARRLGLDGAR